MNEIKEIQNDSFFFEIDKPHTSGAAVETTDGQYALDSKMESNPFTLPNF
jgi:hypothetical protein